MADSDKNILITPNTGQTTEPIIEFTGADNTPITLRVLDDGTVSFEGSAGQLFSVADGLSGTIFSVNDISGIPSIEVLDDGTVKLAEYGGNVGVGKASPSTKLDVDGTVTATSFAGSGSAITNIDWANVDNKPDPTITLGGDLTGSITLTDLVGGTLTAAVADNSHNHTSSNISDFTESVQDVVGGMVSTNTESGISVTYDDANGKLDFDVNDPTISLTGDVTGSATMTNLGNVSIETTIAANSVALGTDTTGNYVATISGTDGVSVTGSGSENAAVTIANTDKGSSQNIFKNVAVSGQSNIVADTNDDTLTFASGTGITLTTNATTDTLTVTNSGITSLSGTANRITVSGSTGSVTISSPQDIHTGASPTFAGATLDAVQIGITTAGEIDTSTGNLTLDSAGGTVTVDDNLIVSGNLTVSGTTTTVNTEEINLADNIIVLNANATGTPTENAGIEIERGDSANVVLRWNESTDTWETTRNGTDYFALVLAGDDIATSDITNFTEDVQDVVGGMVSSNTESGIAVTYDDANGKLNFDVSDPTLTFTGDATGSGTITNLGNTSIELTVADDSHNHIISNVDGLQTALDAKAPLASPTFTGTVILPSTTSIGNVSSTELGYLDGVTSAIQTQLNNKQASDADLTAIAALSGTSGLLKKTAANTWTLDTTTYQASSTALTTSTNFGGDVSGTYNAIVVADDSHNHIISNIDGLQTALDAKAPLASPTFTGTPTAPTATAGTNTTQIATTAFVQAATAALVDSAPTTLDTLNELAAALGDDPNFATTVSTALGNKQPLDADLTAIAALTGTSGFLKKTAADTWSLDTNTYLTGNQTITLTGDVSGSGTTSISVTVTDDSHNHIISNIDGLQNALDAKLNSTSYTASDVLTKIKTVDGAASGLDADLLDGQHGLYYLDWTNTTNKPDPTITLGGDASGSLTLTDLAGGTLTVTIADDSHNHIISNVDGLQTALDAKAPLASASLTGIPTAPTATPGTNTTQIATTEFVQGEIGSFSSIEMSPTEPSNPQDGTLWVDTDSNIDILNVEDYLRKDSASSLYSPLTITEVEKTTDFSLSLTDSGKLLRVNSSSAITVTVPVNASAAFVTGTTILLYRAGTGAVSISAAAGVTVNSINSASAISGQYGQVSLIKRDTNEWLLAGNIE